MNSSSTNNESPTELVRRASSGDGEAMREVFARLYPDIKRMARSRLALVGGVTGLNATALVHEGFMRMAEREGLQGSSRVQFFAYIGKVLRSIVIDFVRERDAEKRGGGVTLLTLSHVGAAPVPWLDNADLALLDVAMQDLKALDERMYQIVEMHLFSGLTCAEIATELGVTERTINREIAKARVLLSQALGTAPPDVE